MSASALPWTGMSSLQSRPHEFTRSLAPASGAAGKAAEKARSSEVEAALVFHFRLACLTDRVESFSDDLVQQLGDAAIRHARRFFERCFHRGRDAPRVDFGLTGHALHGSAILAVNQSTLSGTVRGFVFQRTRGAVAFFSETTGATQRAGRDRR